MALADLDRRSASDGGLAGLTTGLADLDRGLSGLEPGQLVLIGARPAIGKSALAMGFALNAAVREGRPVAFFTLEMSAPETMQRAIASLGAIPLHRLRSARLDADQWGAVNRTSARLAAAPLHVDDSGGLTCPELRARCRRLKRQTGDLALVVVDYLQLMGGDSKAETRTLELGNITRQLKILAKEIGAPVVALSQLNRGLENRSNRRPMLSDLRESGNLEQDADVVLLLYRDEAYNESTSDRGTAEIIIAKQRNGPVGTVRVAFRGEFARFDNLAFPR